MERSLAIFEEALGNGKDLALFRLPGSHRIHYLMGKRIHELHSIEELEGRTGFVAAPFSCDENHPIVLIEGELHELDQDMVAEAEYRYFPATPFPASSAQEKKGYKEHFQVFKSAIDQGIFQKLVLSRKSSRPRPESFSPLQTFLKACGKYPHSYIYLYQSRPTGMWLGCTPEILISGQKSDWKTVALAGTQTAPDTLSDVPEPISPTDNQLALIRWDEKNIAEQNHVATYIRDLLTKEATTVKENGPFTTLAGKLCHLKTEFNFHLEENRKAIRILEELHPTPAVCGLPKQAASDFIRTQEGYTRGWYSGFVGMLDLENGTDLYVNLRCMEILPTRLDLYAGGGLVAASEMEKEWTETENKMGTITSLL